MKNTARVADHPLHPMLIPFPVAMFVTSLVFQIIFAATGNPLWYNIAYYMILVGVIMGLVAAIPGFIDYFTVRMSDRAHKTATTHMALNLTIVALFFINLMNMRGYGANVGSRLTWMIILSVVANLLLLVSGWLGWQLIYRHGIAVSVEDAEREMQEAERRAPTGAQQRMAGQMGGERRTEDQDQNPPPI